VRAVWTTRPWRTTRSRRAHRGTHKTALIRNWFAKRRRFHPRFTPTYVSWLNLVERWFAQLTNKQIRRGVHRSTTELERAIRDFIDAHNAAPAPFRWTKSADEIPASIAPRTHYAGPSSSDHRPHFRERASSMPTSAAPAATFTPRSP
jgi:hypothetical protein